MYCKLFASLYQGTLRGKSDEILVFTNLLAHTSAAGEVDKHFRAIAEETGLSVDRVKQAILVLESPDDESRSPDYEGARIRRIDEHRVWGWHVVNHGKYRAYKNEADRAEKNREAQARFRENKKRAATGESNGGVMNSNGRVMARNESNGSKPIQKQDAEAKTEAVISHTGNKAGFGNPELVTLPDDASPEAVAAWSEWQDYRRSRAEAKGTLKLPWTEQAARMGAKQMMAYIGTHGIQIVCDRISSAITANWKGMNLDNLDAPRQGATAPKSFAQIDREAKEAARHGSVTINAKILTLEG